MINRLAPLVLVLSAAALFAAAPPAAAPPAAASPAAPPADKAGEPSVVFRSDVSLVRVDAQVVDGTNRAITGLRAEDFILREDGKRQEIRNFSSERMPVDVLLLLDVSGSMRPHVERIASAAHQALRVLGEQDRVAIMVFDRSTRVRLPFRSNRGDIEHAFEQLLYEETFNGGTDITRGLLDAANYMARSARPDARHAIVILTDDQTERERDDAGVLRALTRGDTVLSALIAPDAMETGRGSRGPYGGRGGGGGGGWPGQRGGGGWPNNDPLGGIWRRGPYGGRGGGGGPVVIGPRTHSAGTSEIARRSGGDSMRVEDAYAFENTLERIRQRYALYFYLPDGVQPGQERNIEVDLADAARRRYQGAEVHYRRNYLAPGGSNGPELVNNRPPVEDTASRDARDARDPEVPRLRRRPATDQAPVGSRQGPLGGEDAAPASAGSQQNSTEDPQGGWRRVAPNSRPAEPAADKPAENKRTTEPAPTTEGRWRKVKPEE